MKCLNIILDSCIDYLHPEDALPGNVIFEIISLYGILEIVCIHVFNYEKAILLLN